MPIFFSVATDRKPGPDLAITCPICKREDILAGSYEHGEVIKLLWVLPVARHRNTIVECSGCGASLYSKLKIEQIPDSTPEQVDQSLYPQGGMLVFTLFLISIMIFCIPIINLVPAVFVPIANKHAQGVSRVVGYIPLVLALAFNIYFATIFIVSYLNQHP